MDTTSSAKTGFFSKKTLTTVGSVVLAIAAYVAVKAIMGGFSPPERPRVDVNAMISGQMRASFVKAFSDNCMKAQRGAAANKNLPEAKISAYCGCWSDAVANETTNFEVQFSAGMLSQAQIDRNERLAKACLAKV